MFKFYTFYILCLMHCCFVWCLEPELVICAAKCNGASDGSITVITKGRSVYILRLMEEKNNRLLQTYNSNEDSVFVFSNLRSEKYILQIIENGISKDFKLHVEEPAKLLANKIIVEKYPGDNGLCDGEIEVNPTGGTEPYKFNWIEGAVGKNSAKLTGLCENIYTCEVSDSNSCETDKSTVYLFSGFNKNEK